MKARISGYRDALAQAMRRIDDGQIASAIAALARARENGSTVFSMGNGGSAATANHFAADLAKNTRRAGCRSFRTVSLAADVSAITAYGNDDGFDRVFVEQLDTLMREGDVIVAISASGNSSNVITAVSHGKSRGAVVIGLSGFDGGRLKALSDISIHVPSDRYELAEDAHSVVLHTIVSWFKYGGHEPPRQVGKHLSL